MNMLKTLGLAAMMVGFAWIVQTAGFSSVGLLSISPLFLFLGAVLLGGGLGSLAWVIMDDHEEGVLRSRIQRLRQT